MSFRARLGLDLTEFEKAQREVARAIAPVQKQLQSVGRAMSMYVTAPLAGIGTAALKVGGDFQYAMNRVSTLSRGTGDEVEALRKQAQELGRTTQFSASQAADAMGFLAMAGFEANDILGTMPATLDLAAASGMDLARTADTMSNIMQGYGLATEDAARASDVLVAAMTRSNTNLEQLGDAMKYAGPVAKGMGITFEETAAALGMMGNAGIQASMAGTSLRGALTRLASPVGSAANVMRDLGLNVTNADGSMKSLSEIVEQLERSGASTTQMIEIFGQRAGPAMAALVDQGSEALRGLTTELEDSVGEAAKVASVQMEGFRGAMLALKSAAEGVLIAVSESGLLEWATSLANRITGLVQRVAELNPAILRTTVIIAGVAAAIGPALLALGGMAALVPTIVSGFGLLTGAVAALTSPITLTVAAIGGLVAAGVYLYRNFETVRQVTHDAWGAVTSIVGVVVSEVAMYIRGLADLVLDIWGAIGPDVMRYVRGVLENVITVISIALHAIGGKVRALLAVIRGDWSGAWGAMYEAGSKMWDAMRVIVANSIDAILAAISNLVGWIPRIGSRMAEALGKAREAVASIRPVVVGATEDVAAATEVLGEEAERTSDVLEDMSINLAGAGESASGAREAIDALSASLSRIDAIYDAFTGRDHLDRMREQARALTSFLEDAYAGDLGLDAGTIAGYRAQLDALNVAIGETLAARARMTEDPLSAENFLPGLDDTSVRLDGIGQALDLVYQRAMTFGEAVSRILADDVSMAVGRVVEGVIMMEDGFRSLSDTLKSFGEMAQRVFARLIADITAAVTKAAALKGIGSIFGVATGGFGGLVMGALGFGGARAMGGPVMSGQAYEIGR